MRINSILKKSEANGPGKRGVIWVQGCRRNCEGCFNKETQPYEGGKKMKVSSIIKQFELNDLDGITISGGEPFDQAEDLKNLLTEFKKKEINTLVYTGYTYEQLQLNYSDILCLCDYLIDGPYIKTMPSKCRWAGSGNQRFLKLENGKIKKDLTDCEEYSQTAEIIIDESGNITITGFIEE